MKSRWVEHKEKRVCIADYSNFGVNYIALKKEADEIVAVLKNEPPNSVLVISNVEGTQATRENLQVLMDVLPQTNDVVYKRCVVGITGVRWIFVDTFNKISGGKNFQSFKTLEEALDWTVK